MGGTHSCTAEMGGTHSCTAGMVSRPGLGVFTVRKAEAAVPPKYFPYHLFSPRCCSAIAIISTAMLKHGLKLNSCIAPGDFCAVLLAAYKIGDVYPFVLDPQDMTDKLGLSCDPVRITLDKNLILHLDSVAAQKNAAGMKEALGKILIGVTDEIAEKLFCIGNAEARIPTLMSLLRLMVKELDFASLFSSPSSDDCPSRDTLNMFGYGFKELKAAILWASVYHFLYKPDIYAELYAWFAEDFEYFGQAHLNMIEEIERFLPFQNFARHLAGYYCELAAYYHAYKRGAYPKKDGEVCWMIRRNLPELAEGTAASCIGRFSRLSSLSFDVMLSPEGNPTASRKLQGILDGLTKAKPTEEDSSWSSARGGYKAGLRDSCFS